MPVAHKGLAPATLPVKYQFALAEAAAKAGVAPGRQQTARLGPRRGATVRALYRRKGMLLGNGKLLPEDGSRTSKAGQDAAALAGPLGRVGELREGQAPVPGSNFQCSGWTTETNHLGNVVYRTGKKIEWDYEPLRAPNVPRRTPFIKRLCGPQGLGRHSARVGEEASMRL